MQTVDELLERCKMTDRTILACAMAPTGDCLSITTATARPTLRSTRSPIRKSGCGSSAIAGEEVKLTTVFLLAVALSTASFAQENNTTTVPMRHEIGHCNGWPGDHPGERPLPWPSGHWVPATERRGY